MSKALRERARLVYPKVAKVCSLDGLLARRVAMAKEAPAKAKKGEGDMKEEEGEVDVENDDSDATLSDEDQENIDEIPDSQRSTVHKQRLAGNLLKEVRNLKVKYEAQDRLAGQYQCYSVSCSSSGRKACYSPSCMLKERTNGAQIYSRDCSSHKQCYQLWLFFRNSEI